MSYALTIEAVRKFKPCREDISRVEKLLPKRRKINAAKARELGCTYDDVIWIASAVAMDNDDVARRLTAYVNDCAKAVLHFWEERFPDDERPRKAIEACDGFLAGNASEADWKESAWAARAAWAARDVRAARAAWAAWAARDAARAAWAAWAARDVRAARAARDVRAARAAWAAWAARDAARAAWAAWAARDVRAARAAFCDWQYDRLVYWLTESEPKPLPLPEKGKMLPEMEPIKARGEQS